MASSVGIQSPVAVILEMRADMERLVLVNNLGSMIAENLTLYTMLIKARNFILRLSLKLLVFLDD